MVKKELLARCMTCSLCDRLLRNATTISECLHSFCRKCIYKKLRGDDDSDNCCPVCRTNLGIDPTSKLRADHVLQDVRSKIFPFKQTKVKVPQVIASTTLPAKRKERSLSLLVVETPRVTQNTGRRTKGVGRRTSLRGLGPIISECTKPDTKDGDRKRDVLTKAESLNKMPKTRRQDSVHAESSINSINKGLEKDKRSDKDELWKPLECLVEAASQSHPFRSKPQCSGIKREADPSFEVCANKLMARDCVSDSVLHGENDAVPTTRRGVKGRKALGNSRRKKNLRASTSSVIKDLPRQPKQRLPAIWFSLNAASDQNGDPPLPELPKRYIRLADDGSLPASIIQKYAATKLNLQSESEVELLCSGQVVDPSINLYSLLELWLRSRPNHKLQTRVGASGKEFMMELEYGRSKAILS